MNLERLGQPVIWDGQIVNTGDVITVDDTTAAGLLEQGMSTNDKGDPIPVAPQWKTTRRKPTEPDSPADTDTQESEA